MPESSTAIGQAVKHFRQEKGWTIYDLAERMGVAPTTVSKKERGDLSIKPPERKRFAEAFGVTIEEFDAVWRASKVHDRPAPSRIPVINRGPAGQVLPYDHDQSAAGEFHDAFEYIDRGDITDGTAFALIIIGDSMEPTLRENDYVVFAPVHGVPKPSVKLEPGKIICVRIAHEGVTVGRYQPMPEVPGQPRAFLIVKDNAAHKPIVIPYEHVEQLAVAVEIRTKRGL